MLRIFTMLKMSLTTRTMQLLKLECQGIFQNLEKPPQMPRQQTPWAVHQVQRHNTPFHCTGNQDGYEQAKVRRKPCCTRNQELKKKLGLYTCLISCVRCLAMCPTDLAARLLSPPYRPQRIMCIHARRGSASPLFNPVYILPSFLHYLAASFLGGTLFQAFYQVDILCLTWLDYCPLCRV